MKKRISNKIGLWILVVAVFTCFQCVNVKAQTLIDGGTYKGFTYSFDAQSGTVVLESYKGKSKTVVTPKKIKGKKVTEIEGSIFYGNHRIEKLVISEGVEKIGSMAFYDMQSLKSISFPSTLKNLSKNSGFMYYSEASDFPAKTYTVVKGSPAFKYITKNCSGSKIIVKKTNKIVTWFDGNGGGSAPAAKVTVKGKKYGKFPTMSRKGYKFVGWFTKKQGGKKINANAKAKKSQTLYAHWEFLGKRYMLREPRWDKEEECHVWDTIKFGTYKRKSSYDEEKITWLVLSLNGDEALLMAEEGLDAQEYNKRVCEKNAQLEYGYSLPKDCTWETSTLRSWLNGYPATYNVNESDYSSKESSFYNTAFSDAEKSMILDTVVPNSGFTGNNTVDKVYIMSKAEFDNAAYYLKAFDFYPTGYTKNIANISNRSVENKDYFWLRDMASANTAYAMDGLSHEVAVIPTCGYGGTAGWIMKKDDVLPYVYPVIRVNLSNESLWDVGSVVEGN